MQTCEPTPPDAAGGPQLPRRGPGKGPDAEPVTVSGRRDADARADSGAIEYASWLQLLRQLHA